ncbi:MAG: RidA family protein [Halobacteriota archaeon]|nr:RidA family protein [Halobacteriota archaeon]
MKKEVFFTKKAPQPKGAYSQAVIHNGLLYISGQVPIDPITGDIFKGTIEEETRLVLENIKAIVEGAGSEMGDVLNVTCYLADIDEFKGFNRVYGEYFEKKPPARTTIQAGKLPLGVKIEIDAIAAIG